MSGATTRPVAMVTGGHRRVGLAISESLAHAGCDLILTYHTREADAHAAAARLGASRARVELHRVDLADLGAVERLGGEIADAAERLDVLVHSAAIYGSTPLDRIDAQAAERFLRVNAVAPLLLTGRLAPLLGASDLPGGGSVVCMGDIHASGEHSLPRKGFAAYAMSKGALTEMVRSLAREIAPRVRVNAVAPGVVAWPESGPDSDESAQAAYLRHVPLGRAGTPEDAADAVRWLALDARYTTGQILRVDGGRSMV